MDQEHSPVYHAAWSVLHAVNGVLGKAATAKVSAGAVMAGGGSMMVAESTGVSAATWPGALSVVGGIVLFVLNQRAQEKRERKADRRADLSGKLQEIRKEFEHEKSEKDKLRKEFEAARSEKARLASENEKLKQTSEQLKAAADQVRRELDEVKAARGATGFNAGRTDTALEQLRKSGVIKTAFDESGAPARLLIVEDDPQTARALAAVFTEEGFACDFAATCLEAMAKVRSTWPTWVMLDLVLVGCSGEEVLRTIKEENIPTRVCVISGTTDESRVVAAKAMLGPEDVYFAKPIDSIQKLIGKVRAGLHNRVQVRKRPTA